MRNAIFFLCSFSFIALAALGQEIQFTPLSIYKNTQPLLPIGKFGAHTFLLDHADDGSPVLQVLNDSLQPIMAKPWNEVAGDQSLYLPQFLPQGATAVFVAQRRDSNELNAIVRTWDAAGNPQPIKTINLGSWDTVKSTSLNLFDATHAGDTYHLFYKSRMVVNSNTLSFKGVLLDSAWQLVKQVDFKVPYDTEAELFIDALVDSRGNIHLIFSDQPYNFRLSTHLRLYTCRRAESAVRHRDILVKDHKLKDLQVSTDANSLRLKALYMEMNSKDISGIALGAVALEEAATLTASYYPFDGAFRKAMRRIVQGTNPAAVLNQLTIIEHEDQVDGSVVYAQLNPSRQLSTSRSNTYRPVSGNNVFTMPVPPAKSMDDRTYRESRVPEARNYDPVLYFRMSDRPLPTGLFALQVKAAATAPIQLWRSIDKDLRNPANATLIFQKENSTALVTYKALGNEQSQLVSGLLTTEKPTATRSIALPPNTRLQLRYAIRLSRQAYLVPYTNTKTGEAGLGQMKWE